MWGCGHLLHYLPKKRKKNKKIGEGGRARGMVWVKSIVVCQVRVVSSKYQSNLIINKEVMAILAKFNNLTLRVKVIQRSR